MLDLTDSASGGASSGTECPICLDTVTNVRTLKCKHGFCTECLETALKHSNRCPVCKEVQGVIRGNQPEGEMRFHRSLGSLPGYYGNIKKFPKCFTNGHCALTTASVYFAVKKCWKAEIKLLKKPLKQKQAQSLAEFCGIFFIAGRFNKNAIYHHCIVQTARLNGFFNSWSKAKTIYDAHSLFFYIFFVVWHFVPAAVAAATTTRTTT